jgi:predicted helicase
MEVIVDDIAAILNAADINSILDQYYRQGKGEDPIVHFYETFLNQYDPSTREKRGVYYTPEPVVKYIVNSVHHLLKTRFNLPDGLADPSVTVLDPAAGTLTFPAEAIKLAVKEYVGKYGDGGKREFIRNQVLKNFYALELMMAPYAIGHMKMSFLLESLGYRLEGDDSFQLYLTNTLEMEDIAQIEIPGVSSLSEESRLAGKVKQEPVLVIMGNPPYSVSSSNTNIWTEKLLKDDVDSAQSYYKVDDKPLGERNPKMLQDDYVKFLRFAQWKIQKAGKGIVAMITNHAYLDNPTFRGMRQSLMKTFDEIYVLDLHGNSLKKETAPDGGKDENVFDIRQGVAIILLLKNIIPTTNNIYSFDLFGLRDAKYDLLSNHDLSNLDYIRIKPSSPFYFLIQRDVQNIMSYLDWKSIPDIFPVYSVGIVTARDNLTIAYTKKAIFNNVLTFVQNDPEIVRVGFNLGKDSRDWKVNLAQADLKLTGLSQDYIRPILYRPFDIRYTYYTGKSRGFLSMPRHDVMQHFIGNENIAIILPKRVEYKGGWKNAFISEHLAEHVVVSLKNSDYVFPLYLCWSRNQLDWIKPSKSANLEKNLLESLVNIYGVEIESSMIFSYVYGVLYSHIYREKYEQFLIYDFPRIPFTANYEVFQSMAALGKRLIDLHLLTSPELDNPTVKYQGQGDDHSIQKPTYNQKEQRVYINKPHYFEGVEPEVWEYQIGGYQVMQKYLKDRKGRKMDDPRHYIRMATALAKTIEIQAEIDELYPDVEMQVIDF